MPSADKMTGRSVSGKIAVLAMLTALSFALGFLESLNPLSLGIPGVKLGLANLAVLVSIYVLGPAYAVPVMLVRVLICAATFGTASAFFYSLCGGVLSLLTMTVLKKLHFSVTTVSAGGGIAHNIGQMAAACLITGTSRVLFYLPVLLIAGLAAGIVNGILASAVLSAFSKREKH